MKKLLIFLGAIGISATAPISVVSCHFGEEIRNPSDLSQFKESDFTNVIIKWLTTETLESKTIYDDVSNVIVNYLKSNNIIVNLYDLTVLVEVNGKTLSKDENVELKGDGDDFKIRAWFPSFVTVVSNQVDVEVKGMKINSLDSQVFLDSLNELKFKDFNKGIKNLEKVTGEEMSILFTNMVNKVLSNKPYEIRDPLRGADYSFEILTENSSVIDDKMTFNLKESGEKEIYINLVLNNWGVNIWENSKLDLQLEINDQGDIIFS